MVQTLELDARQFMLALEQTERGLTGLQPVAARTEQQMTRGFQGSARAAQASSAQIVASSRRMQFAVGNVANQVADFAVQLQAGANPIRAFTQQLSQALIFAGPWGAALGAAAAVGGALASSFLDVGEGADEATDAVEGLLHLNQNTITTPSLPG